MNRRRLGLGALSALTALGAWIHYRLPSLDEISREMGRDPDLTFEFGADAADHVACEHDKPVDDPYEAENAHAAAAGWVSRLCRKGQEELRFTSLGRRIVAGSSNSARAGVPDGARITMAYRVTVARFERTGPVEVERPRQLSRFRVAVPGRWIPNAAGQRLAQTGWEPLQGAAQREEVFELHLTGWRMIPDSIGRDL